MPSLLLELVAGIGRYALYRRRVVRRKWVARAGSSQRHSPTRHRRGGDREASFEGRPGGPQFDRTGRPSARRSSAICPAW